MSSENPSSPETPPEPPMPSMLGGLNPEELFARGMQSVRMTGGGGLTTWEPPTVEETARLFPNYVIEELIGRGGMGAVYRAKQTALDRNVAVKLLPLEVSIDRDFADRFVREAKTMARMNHPNIVSVFDFGKTTEGHLYFIMEFVEGTTLHQMIKSVGLKPPQALEIIVSVCEALQYAHGEGVVHRDIKPANVLVDVKGRVKVMDFGLARMDAPSAEQWGHTMTGAVLGTPDYMAPEQKSGQRVDHRADIYSLGVMLYEMLCGQVPQGIFAPPSQRVGVDERVDQVVIRAMQQEPDRRYRDTGEMKTDVQMIRQTSEPQPTIAVPRMRPPPPRAVSHIPNARQTPLPSEYVPAAPSGGGDRNTPLIAGIGIAVIAVLGAGFWALDKSRGPSPAVLAVTTPAPATPEPVATPKPEPATPAPVVVAATPKPEPPPPVVVAATPAPLPPVAVIMPTATPMPAVATSPQIAPPPVNTPIGTAPAVTGIMPAATPVPTAAQATAIAAASEFRKAVTEADALMKRRETAGAIEWYSHAITLGEGLPAGVSALEVAELCKKLGQIESNAASAVEARQTYIRGKNILQRARGGAGEGERIRLINEFDMLIGRLKKQIE